ncbi:MAG: FAD-binding oxidoreductase [Candidatus Hydrogenedentes bacterium]|nr:FAD-binding oxidoreductase [Candidatus Hydrogenedentota bacterium]
MNAAIDAWRRILRADQVDDSEPTLSRYSRSSQPQGTRPCCVLYPTCTSDVQEIIRIAWDYEVVVYPISRGKNWGYGDACAPTDGAAILDLSRMNRIVEVNTELAYAVIEPGVTQGQLYDYLQEHETGLWMDCTGAGLDASLVGNTLDRGFGHTRYGDHFLTSCGMEAVLADGRVLRTGFGHYPNAKASNVYPYGVGPYLDGLFCQSNYGIVTQLGLWLMPKPEAFCFFYVTVDHDEDIAIMVDALRPLRMAGILPAALHIGNDLRIFSSRGTYPWKETGGATPLPESERVRLRKMLGIGAWTVGSALTGTHAHVRASCAAVRQAVRGLGKLTFVSDRKMDLIRWAVPRLNRLGLAKRPGELLESLETLFATLKGKPTNQALRGTHWRLRRAPAEDSDDPLDVGGGLMWVSPVLPMTGRDALRVMRIIEPVFARYRFEPLATFTMINERAMIAILNVAFDKADAEESGAAVHCYHDLVDALMAEGYVLYRSGLSGLSKLADEGDPFWQVASEIKRTLDPKDIISRGRYIPPLRPKQAD